MRHTIFIIVAAAIMLGSCGERTEQQLLDCIEEAWQQGETALQEAQVRAEGLRDSVRHTSEYVRQKYNLLAIRLRDKNDQIPSSPDSALHTMSYFEGRKNAVDKERAYYYLGSTYRDLKDYPKAVSCFLKAIDVAKNSKDADTLIWQNALSQLRYLDMLQLNYEEELNMALQAVKLAKASGRNQGWYLMDAASAYKHLNDTLHCLQYCDLACLVIQKENFPPKYGKILAHMLAIYSKYNHYEKVDTLLQQLMQLPEDQRPDNYELGLAMFHEYANNADSAILHYIIYYNKEKTLAGRYEASAGLQRCYLQKGDFRQAAQWGCRLYDTNDSIIAQRAFEQTQRARDTYIYYRNKEKEQAIMQRDEHIIFAFITTGLVLLSIVLGILAFYNYREKKFMKKIFGKDKELEERSRELKQKEKINRELTQIALMNNATANAENVLAHFRKVAVGQAKLEEDSWKDLMSAIETLYPGFHETVQGRLQGQLREPLLRTICLLKIGLKPMEIAQVMDAKKQTVWNRIKRAEDACGDLIAVS
ncbi:MAG: tetratricopeptide repeat protein [Bacteroidaceae bacterium]|nr:tetratricopeptide repeat protein [Bacteroidaceae bacterium]